MHVAGGRKEASPRRIENALVYVIGNLYQEESSTNT
jgi:hypothetical protein